MASQPLTPDAVPPFQRYFASERDMDGQQNEFFRRWRDFWNRGEALDVQGNISYLFCYVYSVLSRPPDKAAPELSRLIQKYPQEEKFIDYCRRWLSDCFVVMQDYRKALELYPPIPVDSRSATCTDDILSLKVRLGEHISGRDALTLNGPNVTKWGKDHLDKVAAYLDIIISAHERNNAINLLECWSKNSHKCPYSVFRGTVLSSEAAIPAYWFSNNPEAMAFVQDKTRDAENSVREEMSIPRIGEGWVSETNLFYELRAHFAGMEIIQHARPSWLRGQHLDIFFPSLFVAVEFQGLQHDEPVEYFGGEEAFRKVKSRDDRKRRLCKRNGIRLIEVRPGYDFQSLIAEVRHPPLEEDKNGNPTIFSSRPSKPTG
jgi:hypothetical protein